MRLLFAMLGACLGAGAMLVIMLMACGCSGGGSLFALDDTGNTSRWRVFDVGPCSDKRPDLAPQDVGGAKDGGGIRSKDDAP